MKRGLALLLVSLMVVFSLTACGKRTNQQATTGSNTATDNQAADQQTANNGTTANQENHPVLDDLENAGENVVHGAEDVGEAVMDGVNEAGNAVTGNNGTANRSAGGVAYNQRTRTAGVL